MLVQPPANQAAGAANSPPMTQLTALLGDASRIQRMQPAAVEAATLLLLVYAGDAGAAEGLLRLGCQPLLSLLRAAGAVEDMPAFQPADMDGDAGSATYGLGARGREDAEEAARRQLQHKLRQVYVAEAVALRRCLLAAAVALAGASRDMLLAEAVQQPKEIGKQKSSKRYKVAGPFLTGAMGQGGAAAPRARAPSTPPACQPPLNHYCCRAAGPGSGAA